MKSYSVSGTFPAAVAHVSQQRVTVSATSWETAAARGLRQLLKRDGIRGKRHQAIKLEIAVISSWVPAGIELVERR